MCFADRSLEPGREGDRRLDRDDHLLVEIDGHIDPDEDEQDQEREQRGGAGGGEDSVPFLRSTGSA